VKRILHLAAIAAVFTLLHFAPGSPRDANAGPILRALYGGYYYDGYGAGYGPRYGAYSGYGYGPYGYGTAPGYAYPATGDYGRGYGEGYESRAIYNGMYDRRYGGPSYFGQPYRQAYNPYGYGGYGPYGY
jgi:hypothetical protein